MSDLVYLSGRSHLARGRESKKETRMKEREKPASGHWMWKNVREFGRWRYTSGLFFYLDSLKTKTKKKKKKREKNTSVRGVLLYVSLFPSFFSP